MPAPGEQHLASGGRTTNPFEEVKPRISEYTAQEIATLQSRLEKQLGPEYISSRAGPSGQKVHYVAAEKCIQLANEVFGFNGWSSQIMDTQVDFVEENPTTMRVSLGLSVVVRVTLRDGTFHEDVGYGHMENAKGKAAAFEKAKKEGTTDGLKRALRNFGNVLGNCIYDKEYLQKVTKVKAPPTKWDVENLHRHSSFVASVVVKKEEIKVAESKPAVATSASVSTDEAMDDEFGEFDEADFGMEDPESHPDEVVLPVIPNTSYHFNAGNNGNAGIANNQNRATNQQQSMAAPARPPNNVNASVNQNQPPQPQTPISGFHRTTNGAGKGIPPPQGTETQAQLHAQSQARARARLAAANAGVPPPITAGRVVNNPNRTSGGLPSAPPSPIRLSTDDIGLPPAGAGFFSARAAQMLPEPAPEAPCEGAPARIPTHLPAFDPHLESKSIPRTPGVDHKASKPLTRDGKHAPKLSQPTIMSPGPGSGIKPGQTMHNNTQLDGVRRIGAPNSPSPLGNRGYKPPTFKRPGPVDDSGGNRTPLTNLPANGAVGGDAKRQKLNG